MSFDTSKQMVVTNNLDISCPVCGWRSNGFRQDYVPYPDDRQNIQQPQHILFCGDCGLGIALPRVDESFLENYNARFWESSKVEYLTPQKSPVMYALALERWNYLKGFLSGADGYDRDISILDVGAGFGYFGAVAAKTPHFRLQQYSVIEKDRVLSQSLKKTWERYFPGIRCEITDQFHNIKDRFDVVVMSHVLEHLYDPGNLIDQAKEKLKPDGIMFIEVPNRDYLFKKRIFPHLIFFNLKSLEKLLSAKSLKILSLGGYGRPYNKTPMNSQGEKLNLFENFLNKLRHVIPSEWLASFLVWYFGANQANTQGTWIRAVTKAI